MNKYFQLCQLKLKAQLDLFEYKKQCATVVLNSSGSNFWNRKFQSYLNSMFPEVVSNYRFSDGCMDYMTLTSPPEDIVSSLQLTLEFFVNKAPEEYLESIRNLISNVQLETEIYLYPEYKRG